MVKEDDVHEAENGFSWLKKMMQLAMRVFECNNYLQDCVFALDDSFFVGFCLLCPIEFEWSPKANLLIDFSVCELCREMVGVRMLV